MKKLKHILGRDESIEKMEEEKKNEIITIDEVKFHIHLYSEKGFQLITEAKHKGTPLGGDYSYNRHQPHNSTGEYHIHGHEGSNEIFAINKSGSAHDGYSGTQIPKKPFEALKKKYPDWNWPANRIIESLDRVYFFNKNARDYLRPVQVEGHKERSTPNNWVESYLGFFHQHATLEKEVLGIIEDEYGYLALVPISKFHFVDV